MPELKLYNTASRKKETFTSETSGLVRLYCCGPTVYNYPHIGNLRTYIFEDWLRRVLEYLDYRVEHVVNITDVGHMTSDGDAGEDKMEVGARREGKTAWDIAREYEQAFWKDWEDLQLLAPTQRPRATDHIADQIELIQRLGKKGCVYLLEDGLYFDTASFPAYAEFARLKLDGQETGERSSVSQEKRNPWDFALWKFTPVHQKRDMEWGSPWGKGFPGWHLECSAMALKHLGETLDIHCGGTDHIAVHHSNEIAQSESATGKPFARFWLHGGWLMDHSESPGLKMSKSSGSFLRLQTLRDKGYSPIDYKYLCLSAHYRSNLAFSWNSLEAARTGLKRLRQRVRPLIRYSEPLRSEKSLYWNSQFLQACCDDLNLPQALAVLHRLLQDPQLMPGEKGSLAEQFDAILGLQLAPQGENKPGLPLRELLNLIGIRRKARAEKKFAKADAIRRNLWGKGYTLKDGPRGTNWNPAL